MLGLARLGHCGACSYRSRAILGMFSFYSGLFTAKTKPHNALTC
ncbi:multidrug transporter [Acetobacter orientalis]|uniref:Multidrug transporter n=1 Tax=Acetobacter orientalis TaxID=146474 RepID=A0A2Z5ZK44_9PROT|nr:multidrug transporter [Acetobacter orientalis]